MQLDILIEEFNEKGFCLIPNLISRRDCEVFKKMLEKNHQDYSNLYSGADATEDGLANKSLEKVVYNLHNKDLKWFQLFENKSILDIFDVVLREGSYGNTEPYYLYNISARCPLKGNMGQQLHLDSNLPGVNYTLTANVVWLLDDFCKDNGATRLVPGSHKWKSYANNGEKHPDEVLIESEKGSALIFNANIWHGGGANLSGQSRWAVLLGYTRWFVKPSFDYMANTPRHLYDKMTDKQKLLLGYNLNAPKDEFTRTRRISPFFEVPEQYSLPSCEQ